MWRLAPPARPCLTGPLTFLLPQAMKLKSEETRKALRDEQLKKVTSLTDRFMVGTMCSSVARLAPTWRVPAGLVGRWPVALSHLIPVPRPTPCFDRASTRPFKSPTSAGGSAAMACAARRWSSTASTRVRTATGL